MKNGFEQHIKQSLENFEASYDPADWSDMQNRLNKAQASGKSTSIGKGLMAAASVMVVSGLVYYFSTSGTTPVDRPVVEKHNVVVEQAKENTTPASVEGVSNPLENTGSVQVQKENLQTVNSTAQQKTTPDPQAEMQRTNVNNAVTEVPVKEQELAPVEHPSAPRPALNASFRTDITRICEGTPVQFLADNYDASCTYKWTFEDGETSVDQKPTHAFAEAGTYSVKLRVTSKDKKYAEQINKITVIAAPSVQMNYSSSEENKLLVSFEADADKVTDWKWDFGDKQTSSLQNPSHTYRKYGSYQVSLTAKNSSGCAAVVVKNLNLSLNLLAPDAFSPNGDGNNDTWMPVELLNGDYTFTLTISDITGNIVHKTSDKNDAWQGSNTKAGDSFRWIAVVKSKTGEEAVCQGLITIKQ